MHRRLTIIGKWSLLTEFLSEFKDKFYEQEVETVAFLKLEGMEYFQGKRTALDYCDAFTKLVQEAEIMDQRMIVSKFRRGLRKDIDKVILKDIRLVLDDSGLWYHKAKDFELVTKFDKAYHDSQTTNPRGTYSFCTQGSFTASAPQVPTLASAAAKSLSEPAKPETPRPKFSLQLNCWNCGEEGHPAWRCTKPKDETKTKVHVTDMPEEDVLALC